MQPKRSPDTTRGPRPEPPTPKEREARERIQRDPGRWRAPREPFDVVHYTVTVDVDREQANALRKLTADLRLYKEGRASLRVVHGNGWARIELADGVLGKGTTFVRAPDGSTLFLDPGLRAFLHLAPDQLAGWHDRPIERVRIGEPRPDEAATRRFAVEVDGAHSEIELDPSPALRPFARQAWSVVLGIPAQQRAEFARLADEGFPVAGATWIASAQALAAPLRWTISDPHVERSDPSLFDVAGDWTNLREGDALVRLAPEGGYTVDVETQAHEHDDHIAEPLDKSWFEIAGILHPVPVGPADAGNQDLIGTCIESRSGNGAGFHLAQRALDDVRMLVNQALRRVQFFMGESGKIRLDWSKQLYDYAQQAQTDGIYQLLRWPPDPTKPWPPLPGDTPGLQRSKRIDRYGGIALIDRFAVRGARRLLANGDYTQLALPPALLAVCNGLAANLALKPADRWDAMTLEDRTLLREIYAEQRIGYLEVAYKTEGKIQELPKSETFPKDLVRYKLFDLSLNVELHPPGQLVAERGDIMRELYVSGPNSITGHLKLFRINGSAVVLRWPGLMFGAFAVGVAVTCLFVPIACAVLAPLAAVTAWLVSDAASVAITLRNPRINFVISWIPDAVKNDQLLYPTVQTSIETSSRSVVYVSAVPDGLHEIIGAVISLGLSFSNEVEDNLADEIKDLIQEALRDDAKLVYPPGQGGLAQTIESAGAFPATPQRLGLGAHYRRPEHPILPFAWATQVDPIEAAFARMNDLDALYFQAFPTPEDEDAKDRQSRPYAVYAWSVNLLNAYLWTRWAERRFDFTIPGELRGTALANAIALHYPGLHPHRDRLRLLCATPPRLELTPWTFAGGTRPAGSLPSAPFGDGYARVSFDDIRLCAPLEGSEAVLELSFPATVVADVVLGSVNARGRLDLLASPETSFEVLFDLPTVAVGPWFTAATRIKAGAPATPLAIAGLKDELAEALRAMLTRWPASAVVRASDDARNVQRYGEGPFGFTSVMIPVGGWLYAYFGLPRYLTLEGFPIPQGYDPAIWLTNPDKMPSQATAQSLLKFIDEKFVKDPDTP
jgi:hypothetical protein